MTDVQTETGWEWFRPLPLPSEDGMKKTDVKRVAKAAARCFQTDEGALVLSYLKRLTIERHLGPEASDASLRYLEGQRQMIAMLLSLIQNGK